ncbi:MAG TPA: GNAT family N-acetyltransferase [Methylomirabilota bacterium]|nr:GNAT family N-acetyltransferase [Methylomirabilota bacterium]
MNLEIRQIRAGEGLRLRTLRLHALADAPTAFGSTLAREEAFPESVWHERAAGGAEGGDRITFIAEQDGRWVGLVTGLAEDPEDPKQSGPVLVGMFVDGTERRHGVGAMLVEGVAAWARARGAARLSLWVFSSTSRRSRSTGNAGSGRRARRSRSPPRPPSRSCGWSAT